MAPTRRLFFTLWLSEQQRRGILDVARPALQVSEGQPVPAHNLHLTLVFLGSVAEGRLPLVCKVANDVSNAWRAGGRPIELTLDAIEYWRKPQVLCSAATQKSAAAIELAERLKRELIDAEFTPDLKAFHAHVTLARKVGRAPPIEWRAAPIPLVFRDFSLVESRTVNGGPLYSVIDSWPLCAR